MAKATLTLGNGTAVTIDGTPEEIRQLLEFYADGHKNEQTQPQRKTKAPRKTQEKASAAQPDASSDRGPDLSAIVNLVKECDEAEAIEKHILDRTSAVHRTLLPLYIVHQHLKTAGGLTSGDVNRITTDLGVPVRTPNASTALSITAKRYVIADKIRRQGVAVRYVLSRRGVEYMKSVLSGGTSTKA